MSHYLIGTMSVLDPDFCFFRDPPDGTDDFTYKMASGERAADEFPPHARIHMDPATPGIVVPSIVGNTWSFLVVSPEVGEILRGSRLGEVEFLEVDVYNHRNRLARAGYLIVNPIGHLDCLDLEASKIEWFDGKIVDIDEYVLDGARLDGAPDLFRIRERPRAYVISGALRDRLEASGATNLDTLELAVTEAGR